MKKRVLRSFPPVARPDARVLILGSMPGEESLRQQQYYAHPKNAFWTIMGRLFGAGRDLPYRRRQARLAAAKVALWDVAGECVRPGSLDSDIEHRSVVPNDFQALFKRCPHIRAVFFNGKKSAELFHKLVWPNLKESDRLAFFILPSTSPAMASLSLGEKTKRWKIVFKNVDRTERNAARDYNQKKTAEYADDADKKKNTCSDIRVVRVIRGKKPCENRKMTD